MDNTTLYVLVALCFVVVAVAALRRLQQRPATTRDLTREQLARLRDQDHIRKSLEELLRQLDAASGRMDAQLDAKLAELATAVQDADQRIAHLERLAGSKPDQTADKRRRARVYELADAGEEPMAIAELLGVPLGEVELLLNLRAFK